MPYRTIDLCAGIGGIRKGFELTGNFINVLSAETDLFARRTYEHLFQEDPLNDLTSDNFKENVDVLEYEILLAGFPCQPFSRAGLQEGFNNETRGIIFAHIADIIERTRPRGVFLENVDHLLTHNRGTTFRQILETLEYDLNYKIIGVTRNEDDELVYGRNGFIRNSRFFGVPQNRPRTYIMGFDRERFEEVDNFAVLLPESRDEVIFNNLNDLLEVEVAPKYYLSQGYLDTLIAHKQRQQDNGNNYGYKILNEEGVENPVSCTLLATGGSGKERNLIYDMREGIPGMVVAKKNTPINTQGIRTLTPTEWGRLQGFIGYAYVNGYGEDEFAFPDGISDFQKYKQFGNTVTIPLVETMADFMYDCLIVMGDDVPVF